MLSEMLTELELRQKDRNSEFLAIGRKVAAGEKVATATVEKLLTESGKTSADLRAVVELITQRALWHELRRRAALLEKERASAQSQIAAEDRKLATAEKAHENATAPLYARLHEIKHAISEASDAGRRLFEACPRDGAADRSGQACPTGRRNRRAIARWTRPPRQHGKDRPLA